MATPTSIKEVARPRGPTSPWPINDLLPGGQCLQGEFRFFRSRATAVYGVAPGQYEQVFGESVDLCQIVCHPDDIE